MLCGVGFLVLGSGVVPVGSLLLVFGVFRVIQRGAIYGLSKPSREVLFTVVSAEEKYKAKNLVDLAMARGGDATGAEVTRRVQLAGMGVAGLASIAAPVSVVWLGVGLALGVGFRKRVAGGQKAGGSGH